MKNTQNTQEQENTSWVSKWFFGIYSTIAAWEKALVESIISWKSEIEWPAIVWGINDIRLFQKVDVEPWHKIMIYVTGEEPKVIDTPWVNFIHPDALVITYEKRVLDEWEKWWLYNEIWEYKEIEWPWEFNVHPEWKLKMFDRVRISEREVIVVVWDDGKEKIIKWSDESEYLLNPAEESLKQFYWTWSWENWPTWEKVANAIVFNKLRLDDSQTYFSFKVRTKDNVVINLDLMLFYKISNIENIIKNTHDPLCEFYNKIQSEVLEEISKKTFDEFKEDTNEQISGIEFLKQDSFESIWLKVSKVSLKEWSPVENNVQRVLEESAMVQSQKTLDKSEHERKMALLDYEKTEQKEKQKLSEWKLKESEEQWEQEAKKLEQVFEWFKKMDKELAVSMMKLYLAKEARELNIGSDMLK